MYTFQPYDMHRVLNWNGPHDWSVPHGNRHASVPGPKHFSKTDSKTNVSWASFWSGSMCPIWECSSQPIRCLRRWSERADSFPLPMATGWCRSSSPTSVPASATKTMGFLVIFILIPLFFLLLLRLENSSAYNYIYFNCR